MSIRKNLLTGALAVFASSASAYEYTGAVKEIDSTNAWPYWQEIRLEAGDNSVWPHCNRFVRVANDLSYTAADCVADAEALSGVIAGQHTRLPIGTLLWVPYLPTTVSIDTSSVDLTTIRADLALLKTELASAATTYVTIDMLNQVLRQEAAEQQAIVTGMLEDLQEQLRSEFSAENEALLVTIAALETAMHTNQPVTFVTPVNSSPELDALTKQVEDLLALRTDLSAMEVRLNERIDTGLADKADRTTVGDLTGRIEQLEKAPTATGVAAGPNWFWWLVGLTLAVIGLVLLAWRLYKTQTGHTQSLGDFDERLLVVEVITCHLVEIDLQGHYKCESLTNLSINEHLINDPPIRLSVPIKGKPGIKVDVYKRKNETGEYLELLGVKAGHNRIDPGKDGRFTLTQVWLKLRRAENSGVIIGLTEASKAS